MKATKYDAKGNPIGHVKYTTIKEMILRGICYFTLTVMILFLLAVGIRVLGWWLDNLLPLVRF
jgi:hypothetical protein